MMRILLSLALLFCAPSLAGDLAALKANPFARPPSDVIRDSQMDTFVEGPIQIIDLRATMVTGESGLANVAGRIMKPGQSRDELTLVTVYEDHAVFLYRGQRLTVYVKRDPNESENED